MTRHALDCGLHCGLAECDCQEQRQCDKPTCPHDDWIVRGPERLGNGTCAQCGEEMRLPELLMNWKARIERELAGRQPPAD